MRALDAMAVLPCGAIALAPGSHCFQRCTPESRGHPSADWGAAEATGMTVRPLSNPEGASVEAAVAVLRAA
jgi:hypothetical protein